ncbi:MAG: L-seryl-tRNA(Sec) selenium transferase [Spirochaetales bacterium]|nr:MAG: L-seryl-tRNA(Sec) selenium transferase [Spirochaetales bacterium]
MMETNERLSGIPQIEQLLSDSELSLFIPLLSRPMTTKAIASVLAAIRRRALADPAYLPDPEACRLLALRTLERINRRRFRKVLNGTGIVLHTNLGRSPIRTDFWDEAREANSSYAPVELDLENGKRGGHGGLTPELAALLVGAEDTLITNNNAAAVLLALSALARGKEVIVARGEQVQIGGGFRIPEILELAGARIVEVGTTNIVDASDYADAVNAETACVLVVHTSIFALRGFTRRPSQAELVKALPPGLPVIVDQGSGCIDEEIPGETPAAAYLKAGCALVCFSGDKLLGGPQAGIIAGRADLVAILREHPLYRAFRPGKTIYSLLERALVARLNGEPGPAGSARERSIDDLKKLARKIRSKLPDGSARVVDSEAASGGGMGPDEAFPSIALALSSTASTELLASALRRAAAPLVGIVRNGEVQVDMAALAHEDPALIAATIEWGLEKSASLMAAARRAEERKLAVGGRSRPIHDGVTVKAAPGEEA